MTSDTKARELPNISFTKVRLTNGLDVIARRQVGLPIVAVNLWYHVGSKNEERTQRGFAHLFEHLMFEGSQNYPGDFFKPLQRLGAGINGSTSADRTNYFVDLPSAHFELALAMESDRMGHLLPALTEAKLRIQKDVVKNEFRQNYANRPYGQVSRVLAEALYPSNHPYSWLTIGMMEDVEAATLDDVEGFFRRFYVPANASLCVVGDLEVDDALASVERYFGPLDGGVQAIRPWAPPVVLSSTQTLTLHDRVELDRIYQVWPTVAQFQPDDAPLSLLSDILSRGRASRLYQRLVVSEELAQDVSAYQSGRELAGSFGVIATQRPGRSLDLCEFAIDEELRSLASQGPRPDELERVRNGWTAAFLFALDNIGGFGGIADRLNAYNTYLGDPGRISADLNRFLAVTAEDIQRVASAYLSEKPRVALRVLGRSHARPLPALDRTIPPSARPAAPYAAPIPEVRTLASGLQLWLLPRNSLPIVAASLVFKGGAGLHGPEQGGLASLTASMLDEGTTSRSSYQIAQAAEQLGTSLSASSGWDGSYVSFQCLSHLLRPSLELAIDLASHPTFPLNEWSRIKAQSLAALTAERDSAESIAHRCLLRSLFPTTHPYHLPIDGAEETVSSLSRDDLQAFHSTYFMPNLAGLIVAGDYDSDILSRLVEELITDWHARPEAPTRFFQEPQSQDSTRIVLANRTGAAQTVVRAGHLGLTRGHTDYDALLLWNQILGGQFSSRLNEVLRETKGYTYGIRSHLDGRRRAGLFWIGASLQSDRLGAALCDLRQEITELLSNRPPTQLELDDARRSLIEGQARHFETPAALVSRYANLFQHNLPLDQHARLAQRLSEISLDSLIECASRHIRPNALTIAIAGDLDTIRRQTDGLGWGAVEISNGSPESTNLNR
jgi:predicted Zn-dependent peptidase